MKKGEIESARESEARLEELQTRRHHLLHAIRCSGISDVDEETYLALERELEESQDLFAIAQVWSMTGVSMKLNHLAKLIGPASMSPRAWALFQALVHNVHHLSDLEREVRERDWPLKRTADTPDQRLH